MTHRDNRNTPSADTQAVMAKLHSECSLSAGTVNTCITVKNIVDVETIDFTQDSPNLE